MASEKAATPAQTLGEEAKPAAPALASDPQGSDDVQITSAPDEVEPPAKKIKKEKTPVENAEEENTEGIIGVEGSVKGEKSVKEEATAKIKHEKTVEVGGEGVKGESVKGESVKGEGVKGESVKGEIKHEGVKKIKHEDSVKGEGVKGEGVKGEGVKGEGVKGEGVKGEGVKGEGVKGEGVKGEGVKGEGVKGEGAKREGVKGEGVKGEGAKGEIKGEGVKGEGAKGEIKGEGVKGEGAKGEIKGEGVKGEGAKGEGVKGEPGIKGEAKGEGVKGEGVKDEFDGKKKKKKDGKVKKEKRSPSKDGDKKKKKKEKKRSASRDGGGKKRKSKWGPDVPVGFNSIPAGRMGQGNAPLSLEDQMPRYSEEEMVVRTLTLENLPSSVSGQELIEFFNGAVLAVTANAVQQASNRSQAPVFACTLKEEESGGKRRKKADLKFRTAEGASVGMKLNGIEYKGHRVTIRRPDKYEVPADGDPSIKLNLHEMSMTKLVGDRTAQQDPSQPIKLSIFNLPDVMTEQVVRDLLSQFGKLRMLSLIRDLSSGKLKGYGIFEYDNSLDVELAVLALNGFVCGQNVIRVQRLGQTQEKTEAKKPQPVAATAMANSMTQKIVSNPVLAMQVKQGREVGSRPSTVVQLLNAVYQEDLMDDNDYDDIMSEIHTEASKHGAVIRVVIPKPPKDGTYIDGLGKCFVQFQDLTAARKFREDGNGRKFENRVVCASFYPVDKFNDGKFKLWSQ